MALFGAVLPGREAGCTGSHGVYFRRYIQASHLGGAPLSVEPLPSRLCPGIWPWPRTQGPAPACCRRRREVGVVLGRTGDGWACLGQGFWPLRLSAQPVSKPWASRSSSQRLLTQCQAPSAVTEGILLFSAPPNSSQTLNLLFRRLYPEMN